MKQPRSQTARNKISYAGLTRALRSLGYAESRGTSAVVFQHPNTRVDLILPPMPPKELVDRTRMSGVYQLVESGGIANRDQLDAALADAAVEK
jgi:hypothetical protein